MEHLVLQKGDESNMKNFEGICMMCKKPLLVHTVSIDGRLRPFCPECKEKIDRKTAQAMERRGRNVKRKTIVFPSVD